MSKKMRRRDVADWARAVIADTELILIHCRQCGLPVVPVLFNSGSGLEIAALRCPADHGGIPVVFGQIGGCEFPGDTS